MKISDELWKAACRISEIDGKRYVCGACTYVYFTQAEFRYWNPSAKDFFVKLFKPLRTNRPYWLAGKNEKANYGFAIQERRFMALLFAHEVALREGK